MDCIFRQIPYTIGFSPLAYRHITDFQILKKQGDFAVESMRTIQLMVAAFNMNNKKTGREAMARAEHLHLLADEQSGSRKYRMASLAALDKVCTADLVRFRHWSAAITSNDAKS